MRVSGEGFTAYVVGNVLELRAIATPLRSEGRFTQQSGSAAPSPLLPTACVHAACGRPAECETKRYGRGRLLQPPLSCSYDRPPAASRREFRGASNRGPQELPNGSG